MSRQRDEDGREGRREGGPVKLAAASIQGERRVPRKSQGQITSEQLREAKADLARQALDLELERERLKEKLAAASIAEQLQAIRTERKQEREGKLTRGRPSTYTDEEAHALCRWIAEGRSLLSWCKQSGRDMSTVYDWMRERPDFASKYARAHEDRSDSLADEILEIADGVAGTESVAAVQAARLQVEARKWIASKLRPQKWGERQIVEQQSNVTFNLAVGRGQSDAPLTLDASGNPLISSTSALLPTARPADYESDSPQNPAAETP